MTEMWKDIKGLEGLYKVSDFGNVLSLRYHNSKKAHLLKPVPTGCGYERVLIGKRLVSVHRLVAEAFIENPLNKPCVNHIDGNKRNNKAENLEWVTYSENSTHAYKTGLMRSVITDKCREASLKTKRKSVGQYTLVGERIAVFESLTQASKRSGFSRQAIANCADGKQETSNGFVWKYEQFN